MKFSKLKTSAIFLLINIVFGILMDTAYGQDTISIKKLKTGKNSILIKLGGNSPFISLNFETKIVEFEKSSLIGQVGIGLDYLKYTEDNFFVYCFPLEITHLLFRSKHHLEYGIGFTPFLSKTATWNTETVSVDIPIDDNYRMYHLIVPELSYRFQEPEKKWLFKIGYTPVLINSSDEIEKFKFRNHAVLAFGISF